MLKNKKVKMALSLILAIGIWIYVVGSMNPVSKATFTGVPIQLTNVEQLTDKGYAISKIGFDTISVTLSGQKSKLAGVETSDITAKVNVSDLDLGENICKIKVKAPSKTEVYDQSEMRVAITVEEIAQEEKMIKPVFDYGQYQDEEPTVLSMEATTVLVTGAKSLVEKVDHVNATISDGQLTEEKQTFTAQLVPVNKNDHPVKQVSTSASSIEIVASLLSTKTVPLNVTIEGLNKGDVERSVSFPEKVTIKGHKEILDTVEAIDAKPVYVGKVTSNSKIKLELIIPDGVSIANTNPAMEVKVTIAEKETKTFAIDSQQVQIDTDKNYEIEQETIKITVIGSKEVISKLTEDSFELSANIEEDATGRIKVKIKCHVDETVDSIEVNPDKIQITIEE